MYKKDDYVIYNNYVCKVRGIIEKLVDDTDYYDLINVYDNDLSLKVPLNKSDLLKPLMTNEKLEKLLNNIPLIKKDDNDVDLSQIYRKYIKSNDRENLLRIIKDEYYYKNTDPELLSCLEIAESSLYSEISITRNISYDKAKELVLKTIEKN